MVWFGGEVGGERQNGIAATGSLKGDIRGRQRPAHRSNAPMEDRRGCGADRRGLIVVTHRVT